MTTDTSGAQGGAAQTSSGIDLIEAFANTIDYDLGTDSLTTPAELTVFLVDHDLLPRRVPSSDQNLATARRLRSGLRDAMASNHDERPTALPDLDAALSSLPLRLHWAASGPSLVPAASGVEGALSRLVVAVAESAADDTWSRLKICADDGCAWAYYDTSKNRSKHWCGQTCSNKSKTRAYRARKRAGDT